MLPIYLSEPSNEPARHRTAAAIARQRLPAAPDAAAVRQDRTRSASRLRKLIGAFAATVAARGVPVFHAAAAAAAAHRIAEIAGGLPVATTRAAVLGELYAPLAARGLTLVPTYGPGSVDFVPRRHRFWQLPPHAPAPNWRTQAVPEIAGPRRNVVGLFGVNAASAASGALYLLQHSTNISNLLRTARRLIFVVAVDKLVTDDDAARRQVEAAGTWGADSVLLDLARTVPVGDVLASFAATEEPASLEVIVLDNGRTGLLGSRYAALLTCIGCRACATRCPTYPEFRGARGWSPKDYLWNHLLGNNPALDLCTLCGNCEVDCPVEIPLPTIIAQRRAERIVTHGRGLPGWRRRVQGDVGCLDKLFSASAPLSNYVQRVPLANSVMSNVFGLTAERPLPPFRRDTFERWYAGRRPPPPSTKHRPRIVYYFGCFANYNNPEVGQATVKILEALGHDVILPKWRCCGIPLYAKGEIAAARRLAAYNLKRLSAHVDAGREIVTSCPSCHLALARDYPRLFPSSAAEWVAAHTHFLSRFLLAAGGRAARLGAVPQRAAYHLPCHLRALGMEEDSLRLLRQIPELAVTDLKRGCCGLSGTFGIERAHYGQSMEIGSGLFAAVQENDFDLVLTDCGACKLQIEHGTGRSVAHPLEIVCAAMHSDRAVTPAAGARVSSTSAPLCAANDGVSV